MHGDVDGVECKPGGGHNLPRVVHVQLALVHVERQSIIASGGYVLMGAQSLHQPLVSVSINDSLYIASLTNR